MINKNSNILCYVMNKRKLLKPIVFGEKKKFMGREYDGIFRNTYVIDENGLIEKVYKKINVKTHALDILVEL